jgi:uncharacterized membrane protein YidH (DUF202 family)
VSTVWDPGLQPERTALAWRRTAIALAVGSIAALRILPELAGAIGTVLGVLGLAGAVALAIAAEARYRTVHARLVRSAAAGSAPRVGGGALLAAIAAGTLVIAVVAAGVVATLASGLLHL